MKLSSSIVRAATALALVATAMPAHATLLRVGPPNPAPSVGFFPSWYQDTTGLALEFCDPKNVAEVNGGWCLLLPGDVNVPEVFPTNFFDEHFYFAANASAATASGARALLTLATEAAFAIGPAIPGDQITFSRIRVTLSPAPATGTYRFIHPYGEEIIDAAAGGRIFFTEDIGIGAPGDFTGALNSRIGPFLLPSATPGGPEMPALDAAHPTPDTDPLHFGGAFAPTAYPGTGKAYIADPARIGPVTGSSLPAFVDSTGALRNHNIFRIEGPPGSRLGVDAVTGAAVDWVETTDFSLMGRIFTSPLGNQIGVQRASYTHDATGQKVDVFATAFPTTQTRLPTQATPAPIPPQLTFFAAPCAGVLDPLTGAINPPFSAPVGVPETQMFTMTGGLHWGQALPAAIPTSVCVKDTTVRDVAGNIVPSFVNKLVTDEVTVTNAFYDPSTGTLSVAARSSDTVVPPVLTLAYGTSLVDLVNGQIAVPGLVAPPASIRVLSSAFGSTAYEVTTGFAAGAPNAGIPVAANDSFTFLEDAGPQILNLLGNDTNAAGGRVAITAPTRLGITVVNPDGTVTYTANPNVFGTDSFTYAVTVGAQVSNTATVTVNVTPVNDAPTAVNDTANAIAGIAQTINVLANDIDPDGAADLVAAVIVTPPTGATVTVTGGVVTFTAATSGTRSFTYRARDAAGALSANTATVTVNVAAAETVTIARAQYTVSGGRLVANGTVTPASGQTIRLDFVNSAGTVVGTPVAAAPTDAAGAWAVDVRNLPLPAGTTAIRATTSNGRSAALALSVK